MLAASIAALMGDTLLEPSGLAVILFFIISFALIFVVLSVVFYLESNVVFGSKSIFKNTYVISDLGTPGLIVCVSVFSLEVAMVLSLIAWLLLFRHHYETGFLSSITVGLTSVIVAAIILIVLDMFLGNLTLIFRWLIYFS